MAASSGFIIAEAERRLPVRIRIGIPPDGLGSRLDLIQAWLDEGRSAIGQHPAKFAVQVGVLRR